jgi:putative hydroxymethylpyrimidine transport system substrate-binding protein
MKPVLKAGMLLFLFLGLLGPCRAHALEETTVILDWFVNPDHAGLIVAKEKGFFEKNGLSVKFQVPSNPNDPPKLVAAGKADLAISYQPQHHLHVDRGLPLVRIATLVATPLNCLVVLADGEIKGIADLKGKRIGYSIGGFETVLLKTMLARHGLSLSDVTLINVNFSLSPSLFAGTTDAVIGAFRNFELNQMEIEKRPGRAFFVEEHGIPPYDELILVAHRRTVKDPKLRGFVDALEAGTRFLVNHPEESWELFLKHRKALDDELNRRAWKDTLRRFALRPAALDRKRYERFARFAEENGLIKHIPDLETYAVEVP